MIKTRILLGLCMMLGTATVQIGLAQADDASKLKLARKKSARFFAWNG
jgi:hypothetical protein